MSIDHKSNLMDMSIDHKILVEKATTYLKELVPSASNITFEELGSSLSVENPPNAAYVVLSYKDTNYEKGVEDIAKLFSKKAKRIFIDPSSGELLAIKNTLG